MPPKIWTISKWHAPPASPQEVRREPFFLTTSLSKQENVEIITLANLGMTVNTIAEFTGLSKSIVSYRLKRYGISTRDFRHGRGPIAQLVFNKLANQVATRSITIARQHLY